MNAREVVKMRACFAASDLCAQKAIQYRGGEARAYLKTALRCQSAAITGKKSPGLLMRAQCYSDPIALRLREAI
jgi:hypothetical protein